MTSLLNGAVVLVFILIIMNNIIKAQGDEQNEIDLFPKHFANAVPLIKNQIEQTEFMSRPQLYGYCLTNDLNFQHYVYEVI